MNEMKMKLAFNNDDGKKNYTENYLQKLFT